MGTARLKRRLLLLLLPLGGCYNIITLNVGGVQKQAAGAGVPPPPEVQCAALTHGVDVETDKATLKAVQLCEEMIAKQQQQKGK